MGEFNSDDHYIYYYGKESLRKNGVALIVNRSPKCSSWVQSQKWQKGLGSFPRQTIQHHSNPSLCPNHWCQRSWSWPLLWRPITPSRNNIFFKYPFKHRNLRDTWSNRQVWPWSTKWAGKKLTDFCPENTLFIANTLFQQHKRQLYTWTSPDGQYRNQIHHVLCIWRWRNSIQSPKTKPEVDSDHHLLIAKFSLKLKKVGKTTRPFKYDINQIPYDYIVEMTNRFKI